MADTTETECMMCHSEMIKLPSFFKDTCFHCRRTPGKPGCHSIQRSCLPCIRSYLQLNLPKSERSNRVKCPLCPAFTDPTRLNQQKAYDLDYRMMAQDKRTDIPCIHDTKCSFRGTQFELHRHVQTECPERHTTCPHCNVMYIAKNQKSHEELCVAMILCPICHLRVGTAQRNHHLRQVHHREACARCETSVPIGHMNHHNKEDCVFRSEECPYCHQQEFVKDMLSHLQQHLEVSQQEVKNHCELMNAHQRETHRICALMMDIVHPNKN